MIKNISILSLSCSQSLFLLSNSLFAFLPKLKFLSLAVDKLCWSAQVLFFQLFALNLHSIAISANLINSTYLAEISNLSETIHWSTESKKFQVATCLRLCKRSYKYNGDDKFKLESGIELKQKRNSHYLKYQQLDINCEVFPNLGILWDV